MDFAAGKMQTNLLLRCPAAASPDKAGSRLADRCHCDSLRAALWAVARLHSACGR